MDVFRLSSRVEDEGAAIAAKMIQTMIGQTPVRARACRGAGVRRWQVVSRVEKGVNASIQVPVYNTVGSWPGTGMRAINGSVDDGHALQVSKEEISKSVESLGFPQKLHLQNSSISIYNSKILLVLFNTLQ